MKNKARVLADYSVSVRSNGATVARYRYQKFHHADGQNDEAVTRVEPATGSVSHVARRSFLKYAVPWEITLGEQSCGSIAPRTDKEGIATRLFEMDIKHESYEERARYINEISGREDIKWTADDVKYCDEVDKYPIEELSAMLGIVIRVDEE